MMNNKQPILNIKSPSSTLLIIKKANHFVWVIY